MRKTSFLRGAMILTVAGVVVKMLGGVNRILLSRILGGEGIGLYQMAYPLYILLLSIAGAGIPIAVSILVAEKASQSAYGEGRRILKIALLALGGCGVLLAAAMIPAASILVSAGIVSDGRVQLSLAVLAPALAISIVTCCFRGYFQGLQLMTPTAVSQMCDQFIRVCVMLSLAFLLFPSGLEKAAAGAAFGAVPGAAAGLAVMLFFYFRHLRAAEYAALSNGAAARESSLHIVRRLLTLAIPVAAANMLLPAVASIDLFIVHIRYEDRDRLTAFVAKLAAACHGWGLNVSMDITPLSDSKEWSLVYDRQALAPYLDYVVLMAYDQVGRTSSTAGPVASYPWVVHSVETLKALVPAEKIILGIPLYMRIWYETDANENLPDALDKWPKTVAEAKRDRPGNAMIAPNVGTRKERKLFVRTLTLADSKKLAEKYAAYLTWDERLQLNYLELPLVTGTVKIWFEDDKTLAAKRNLAVREGLGGVAFWRKGFEDNGFWQGFAKHELT